MKIIKGLGKLKTALILRKKAESLLCRKLSKTNLEFPESEALKHIHELEVYQIELEMQSIELIDQNKIKTKRAAELIIANKELLYQNDEKAKRVAELFFANKELALKAELASANTELIRKNKVLHKINAEKNKFFSISAHDLRGPLGVLMELTEMLAEEDLYITESERKKLTIGLSQSVRNTFNLLENLLEWSQMDLGLTSLKPQKLDLTFLVNECLNIVGESARGKMIELVTNIPNPSLVFADKNMVQTVIRNLLSNAIKFTPIGGKVTITADSAENSMTLISVKDTGIGMTDEMVQCLFSIDSNIKRTGTNGELSTGLGLLLCKAFVEKHSGKITIESEQNKGSVFTFSIPSIAQKEIEIVNLKVELTDEA